MLIVFIKHFFHNFLYYLLIQWMKQKNIIIIKTCIKSNIIKDAMTYLVYRDMNRGSHEADKLSSHIILVRIKL